MTMMRIDTYDGVFALTPLTLVDLGSSLVYSGNMILMTRSARHVRNDIIQ